MEPTYEWLCGWIQTATPGMLPAPPFSLYGQVNVVGCEKFLRSLQFDATRPTVGRGMTGALEKDLRTIHAIVIGNSEF